MKGAAHHVEDNDFEDPSLELSQLQTERGDLLVLLAAQELETVALATALERVGGPRAVAAARMEGVKAIDAASGGTITGALADADLSGIGAGPHGFGEGGLADQSFEQPAGMPSVAAGMQSHGITQVQTGTHGRGNGDIDGASPVVESFRGDRPGYDESPEHRVVNYQQPDQYQDRDNGMRYEGGPESPAEQRVGGSQWETGDEGGRARAV